MFYLVIYYILSYFCPMNQTYHLLSHLPSLGAIQNSTTSLLNKIATLIALLPAIMIDCT